MSDVWSFNEFDAGRTLDISRMKNLIEGFIFFLFSLGVFFIVLFVFINVYLSKRLVRLAAVNFEHLFIFCCTGGTMQTCSCWTGTFLASAGAPRVILRSEVHQVYLSFFFWLLFLFKHLLFMVGPHWHSLAAQLPQQSIPLLPLPRQSG